MYRNIIPSFGLLVALSSIVPACQSPATVAQHHAKAEAAQDPVNDGAKSKPNELILRTYEVPPSRAEEVASVLSHALRTNKDTPNRGTVNRLDDGRLVVLASRAVQEGIAQTCADLVKRPAPPAPATVELSYWLVVGSNADSNNSEPPPPLLQPALEQITKQDGVSNFSLIEATRIASLSTARGATRSGATEYEQRATVVGKTILADVDIESQGTSLETRISLNPGQLVVLGQSYVKRPGADGVRGKRLYYIVRGEILAQ